MEILRSWPHQVATRVRSLIAASGHTEERVGSDAGITDATMSGRLDGHTPFTLGELERIAATLEISPARFFEPKETSR
ncbi:hypothetical protein [Nocardia sp. NPDC020380]|uniref:hypothetical protein n=1 Tax=Nocardia sp. NPDC020380 TaxID=3364309 RepID=UPI0037B7DC89